MLDEVKKRLSSSCHQDWDNFTPMVPISDDANAYVNDVLGGYLHIPLKSILFNGVDLRTLGVAEVIDINIIFHEWR